MKLKIKVTKSILKRSMMCGTVKGKGKISESCAIALAVRDTFPMANIRPTYIDVCEFDSPQLRIRLPEEARAFIIRFDCNSPKQRLELPELEFEVDVPEAIFDSIGIKEATKIINESPTLELA